jgi:hypothetical protein
VKTLGWTRGLGNQLLPTSGGEDYSFAANTSVLLSEAMTQQHTPQEESRDTTLPDQSPKTKKLFRDTDFEAYRS